jgi:hypothetical protein
MTINYEKKVTSQNGEDGIIEVMVTHIKNPNKKFLEIGWGDGSANMTTNLLKQGWRGVAVDPAVPASGTTDYEGLLHFQEYVYPHTCRKYLEHVPVDCDFFSLDIDSFDYDVAKELLELGFRPKTVCVEINKLFGITAVASFPYRDKSVSKKKLYRKISHFGCSLEKFRRLWNQFGYEYFGYDSSATNAFFYHYDTCNKIELPILSDEKFPVKEDQVLDIINGHPYWNQNQQLIYRSSL